MFGKVGRKTALDILFQNGTVIGNVEIRLATNVPSGDEEDWDIGDFNECTFAGYAAKVNEDFTDAILDGSDRGEVVSPVLTWTAGAIVSPETIRMVYIVVQLNGMGPYRYLWSKEISPTVTLSNPGETFTRQLTFKSNDFTP